MSLKPLLPLTLLALLAAAPTTTNPEANTKWNKHETYTTDPDGALHATGLHSFEGIEEPLMKVVVATDKTEHDDFTNITEEPTGITRMFLRYNKDFWDGDQGTARKDRQRAEIKGIGPHQKLDETFEYGTTFRTDPDFKAYGRFCHIMQVKATNGDNAPPLVTLSILDDTHAALRYVSGTDGFKTAKEFPWTPNTWTTIRFRLKTSIKPEGELLLSVNGSPFEGVKNIPLFRPNGTDYRPKWGLYRGTVEGMHDDWIEHKDQLVKKIETPATQPPPLK